MIPKKTHTPLRAGAREEEDEGGRSDVLLFLSPRGIPSCVAWRVFMLTVVVSDVTAHALQSLCMRISLVRCLYLSPARQLSCRMGRRTQNDDPIARGPFLHCVYFNFANKVGGA